MPLPYPDSAKRENFCGGWDFQKAQVLDRLAALAHGLWVLVELAHGDK